MPVLGWPGPQSTTQFRDAIAPLVTHTQQVFGAARTLWASNFPMDKPTVSLPGTIEALLDVLVSDADPQRLLHDNAARVYRVQPR